MSCEECMETPGAFFMNMNGGTCQGINEPMVMDIPACFREYPKMKDDDSYGNAKQCCDSLCKQ